MAKLHVRVPGLWPGAGLQHHQVLQGDGRSEFRAAGKSREDLFVKFLFFFSQLIYSGGVSLDMSPSGSRVPENVSIRSTEKNRLDNRFWV